MMRSNKMLVAGLVAATAVFTTGLVGSLGLQEAFAANNNNNCNNNNEGVNVGVCANVPVCAQIVVIGKQNSNRCE